MGESKRKRDWRRINQDALVEMGGDFLAAQMARLDIFVLDHFLTAYPHQGMAWLLKLSRAEPAAMCITCDNEIGPPNHHFTPAVAVLYPQYLDNRAPKDISMSGVCDDCCEKLKTLDAIRTACYAVIKTKWMPESQPIAGVGSA